MRGLGLGLGLTRASVASVTFETEATTYFAAMSVQPDSTRKSQLNTLIAGLKTDGIWAKLDWLCVLASHDAQAARLNAKNTAKALTASGSMTFTTDRGYAGDGSTGFLDLAEPFGNTGNNFTKDSAALGVWCNLGSGTTLLAQLGEYGGTATAVLRARNSAGNETFQLNDAGTTDAFQANVGTKTGHRAASRTGAAVKRAFYNGTRTADLTTASTALSGINGALLRLTSVFSADRLAAFWSGGGLTDTEVGNLHSRLSTYLTAIGAN